MILKTDMPTGGSSGSATSPRSSWARRRTTRPARSTASPRWPSRSISVPAPTPSRPRGSSARRWSELKDRFPEGLDYAIVYDTTPFIDESVNEVFKTLRDAVILVAVVVLLFLQNWRSAIIPLVAVPVAIIGTFAVMAALGFSLNNLTLFGLVLAIGIVVDDAIVVVEAVEHHIEHGLAPREATIQAMEEVSGPVIAIGPGAGGGVRAVCVHHGDRRPVLPPVRLDDRRLDADLGVQLADAEPRAGGPAAAASRHRRRTRLGTPGRPAAASCIRSGWRLAGSHLPPAENARLAPLGRSGLAGGDARMDPGGGGDRHRRAGRLRRQRSPEPRARPVFFAAFNAGFRRATDGYVGLVGLLLRGSAVVLLGYGGLLYLTYQGLADHPDRVHPVPGQGLPARQRPAPRLDLHRAKPSG